MKESAREYDDKNLRCKQSITPLRQRIRYAYPLSWRLKAVRVTALRYSPEVYPYPPGASEYPIEVYSIHPRSPWIPSRSVSMLPGAAHAQFRVACARIVPSCCCLPPCCCASTSEASCCWRNSPIRRELCLAIENSGFGHLACFLRIKERGNKPSFNPLRERNTTK